MSNQGLTAILRLGLAATALVVMSAWAAGGDSLQVFQNLEEITSRIPQLSKKPYMQLIAACDGCMQSEVVVFKDIETGAEVWSLTREECTELANIERRCAWSCNGQYISFIGNAVFLNYENNQMWKRTWAGYNYVANSDGSRKRKLWAVADGRLRMFQDKFNNWDAKRPNVLYYPDKDLLWRITLADGVKDSRAEAVYKFPNAQPKIVQEISDGDFMLVEESGQNANCYVINLNREPKDPLFCMTYPLKGEVHPGSFRFRRSRLLVTGGYENHSLGGVRLLVDPDKGQFAEAPAEQDPWGVQMAHLWYGPPDDRACFSGNARGKGSGLFVQMPGREPVQLAQVSDGHPSWCGHDPDWFFYAVGTPDTNSPYSRHLVAGKADGSELRKICTPFDRRRGANEGGYDAIPRPNQSPDATKCWFHSSMLNADNKYTGSYVAVFRRPYPPTALKLKPGARGVELEWTPHVLSYEARGYHVYRSADGGKTFNEVTKDAVAGTAYKDALATAGSYSYAVTAEEWSRLESDVTSPVLRVSVTQAGATSSGSGPAVKGWDRSAPAKVAGLSVGRSQDGLIEIRWQRSAEADLRYYNIYASSAGKPAAEQKRLLVSPPHDETRYIDWTAPAGAVYYAVTAVDRAGNESEPVYAEAK